MKCSNCGFESDQSYSFCPRCGAAEAAQPVSCPSSAADRVLQALKDKLFLVICILMSALCVLSLSADSMPLIQILATVFLWLTYAQSRKDIADPKHLRCVSGTVYAQYVITYVLAVLLLVLGMVLSAFLGTLTSDPEFMESLLSGMVDTAGIYGEVAPLIASISSSVIMVIFALIAAVMVVINIFSLRYIHRFVKSVYQSVETGTLALAHTKAAQVWLFIYGGLSAASALSNLGTAGLIPALCSGTEAAVVILAGLLIRKYFPCNK